MRIVEDAITDLLSVDLVNAERLSFLDLKCTASRGRNDESFCEGAR